MIVLKREVGRYVGQQCHALDDFSQRCQAAQIAQNQMGHGALAQAAQGGANRIVIGKLPLQRRLQHGFGERLLPGGEQFGNQFRVRLQQVCEIAAVVYSHLPAGI